MTIVIETEQPRQPTQAHYTLPQGACDSHVHIFGPYARFPPAVTPSYALPDAPADTHRQARAIVGLDRAILVQPSAYGVDNSALVDTLSQDPTALRGVAVVAEDVSDATLNALHAAGVRGLRFVEVRVPGTGDRYAGSVGITALPGLASRMRAYGWHAQIWAPLAQCPEIASMSDALGIVPVFDHLAGAQMNDDAQAGAFADIVAAVQDGRAWVKLSICRVGPTLEDYDRARPFHEALVQANAAQLLWGTDYPFLRKGLEAPDIGRLLDTLRDWTSDDVLLTRILVENPARFYEFSPIRSAIS